MKNRGLLLLIIISIFYTSIGYSQCSANAGNNVSICLGGSVTLGGTSTGDGTLTYSWSPSTDLSCDNCPSPVATPTSTRTYTLTIEDSDGCISTDNVQVTVNSLPDASFSFLPNNVCANTPISFSANSVVGGNTYAWNFGNTASGGSNTAFSPNAIHEFVSYGTTNETFNVTLTVTNANGCQSNTTQSVTINSLPQATLMDPMANFKNCDGTTFDMTVYDLTPNPGTNYQIIWGDGSVNFNSSTAPSGGAFHQYTTADIFDMYYIVTATNGCVDTAHYIVSNITNPAIGAANPGATTGCGPLTLCFPLSNYATNHPSTYYIIDYGDDSPIDTIQHANLPSQICHTYTQTSCGRPGNAFTFQIQAENPCDISIATITPIRIYTAPEPHFTNPERACVNTGVTFINNTIAGYNSSCQTTTLYQWDFGDGTVTPFTPIHTNPVHTYTAPGTYTVTLNVQNGCGTESISNEICIEAVPVPDFVLNPDTGCVPFTSSVTNNSDTTDICQYTINWQMINYTTTCPATQSWEFANGTNASSWEPEFTFSSAGNYIIRLGITNTCGTFYYNDTIEAQGVPQISLTSPASICEGESIAPTVTVNDCYGAVTDYLWTFPSGAPVSSTDSLPGSIAYPNAGSYSVGIEVTNVCGSANASAALVVNEPPVADAGSDVDFCSGEDAVIGSAPEAGITYQWSPATDLSASNQSSVSANPTNGGDIPMEIEYVLTASTSPTCFSTDTVIVTVNPVPVPSVNNPIICLGESAQLEATATTSPIDFEWTTHIDLSCTNCNNPTVTPTTTTSYSVTATNQYGCEATAQSTVTVNPLPVVDAGTDQTVCDQPIPFDLTGTPAGGMWSGSPNVTIGGTFTPNGAEVAEMVYTYIDPVTNCENSDTVIITVQPPVIPDFNPTPEVCINAGMVDLNTAFAPNPLGGTWSGANVTGADFNPATAGLGQHTVEYTYGTGTCEIVSPVEITVNLEPVIIVDDETICAGETVVLAASGAGIGGTYEWTPSTGLSCDDCETPDASPASTTIYTITGTNAFGCSSSTTTTVTVNPLPMVNAGTDQLVCNQPIPFDVVGTPAGGTWSGSPNVTVDGTFTPNGAEVVELVYAYTDPVTGCESSDTVEITVSEPVIPIINPLDSLCINDAAANLEVFLNAVPTGGVFSGAGVSGATFNPLSAGIGAHEIVYSYGSGTCLTSDTATINVNPFPDVAAVGDVICMGETASVSASGSDITTTYSWSPSGDLSCDDCPNPSANPIATTVYTVVGTNAFGCSNDATATVTVNSLPVVDAGADQILCDQPIPIQLNGAPAGGTWSGSPNISASGEFIPNGTENADVVYSYTDLATGCTNTDTVNIVVSPPVIPTFNTGIEICINTGTVDLNTVFAPNPLGGAWSGAGVTGAVFNPLTTGTGTHSLDYTYGIGTCQTINPVDIIVNPEPVILSSDEIICFGESIPLTASGAGAGGSYAWSPSTGLSCDDCDNPTANPASTTVYTITGTNIHGCLSSTTSTVTVNPLPAVNAGNDTLLCNQPIGVQFDGTIAGGTWSGTDISPSGVFTPSSTGAFTVTYTVVIGATGCQDSDDKIVTVIDPANADAGIDLEECIDNISVLVVGAPAGGTWTGTNIDAAGNFSIATDGTFELVYSYGAGNCLTRDTMLFTVHPLPVVDAGNDIELCISEPIATLTGAPAGGTFSGTGITDGTLGLFDPATAGEGSFTITYTYTEPITGCVNSDDLIAVVRPLPVVNFSADPIVCQNTDVPFTNTSTLVNQSAWNFGDGGASSDNNPIHVYTSSGMFDVQLIVTTQYGCIDSITQPIEVYVPPTVDFDVTPDSLCGPLMATFQNNSAGPDVTYLWDFGNGTTSTDPNPAPVTYPAGILADTSYTITLTVTNYCGQLSTQETVIVMPQPVAVFGTDLNSFCSPWTPNIANTSYGLPDDYYWDFGNGTTSTTSDSLFQLPVYTTGTDTTSYTIMLAVSNECGADTAYHTITVLPNTVNSFFNTNTTEGCAALTVDFTQYTLGSTNYHWNFGDGNVSTTYSPAHTFTQAGTYNVSLMVDNGCSFDTTTVSITVHPSPVLEFSYQPDSVCNLTPLQFINESEPLANYHWDFGDGNTSNLTNPVHSYANPGDYTVTLSGTSADGYCSATYSKIVHINSPPVAGFALDPQIGCVPLDVQFTNQSTGYAYSYWDFGDGNTSTAIHPQHTYTTEGTYIVRLIVQGINGCSDTIAQYVNVNPVPVADFSYQPTGTICGPDIEAQFTNLSTGAVGYQWSFGDGGSSTLVTPSYDYLTAGTFTIQLVASNQFGCTDTATQQITVHQTPVADFSLPSLLGCEDTYTLFNSSSLYADSVIWNFGNGDILVGDNVYYQYADTGSYVISITVFGSGGCSDSFTASSVYNVQTSPDAHFNYETTTENVTNATVIFTNTSENYSSSWWDFGNGDNSTEDSPVHHYYEHNDFYVTLVVTNINGCTDTAQIWVKNPLLQDLYIPNAVYPGHGSFEVSHFLPKGIGLKEYHIEIYDDWGNLIWESTLLDELGRPVEGWDATYKGAPVQQDAYVWKVSAIFLDESIWEGKEYPKGKIKRSGTVTVIR
jgi:PKD repeat protein